MLIGYIGEVIRNGPGHFSPEYGGRIFCQNIGVFVGDRVTYLEEYMAHQHRSQSELIPL